jgi:OmpA-OmpF porin, OOP family
MRKYLFVSAAAAALAAAATPAAAKDGQWYVEGDFGVTLPSDNDLDIVATSGTSVVDIGNALDVDYRTGIEGALIGGRDFGMFRVEGEFGWRHSELANLDFSQEWIDAIEDITNSIVADDEVELTRDSDVISIMVNGLLDVDFTQDQTFSGYIGGGIGIGWIDEYGSSKGSFAWQAIAGVRYAISRDIDIGLKYRYFSMGNLDYSVDGVMIDGTPFGLVLGGKYHTHSFLGTIGYNF